MKRLAMTQMLQFVSIGFPEFNLEVNEEKRKNAVSESFQVMKSNRVRILIAVDDHVEFFLS